MTTSRDEDIRPVAMRIVLTQAGTGAIIALVCGVAWGMRAGLSALAGAAIGVIANLYMTLKALQPARTAQGALGHVLMGQMVKVALTIGLFVVASRVPGTRWPALLVAYVSTLVVFWWVPFAAGMKKSRS